MRPWLSVAVAIAVASLACDLYRPPCRPRLATVAVGLTHPRGIARGPDGLLYVAEAGVQATGGRISRVDLAGRVTVLASGLPHSVNAGVEDVGPAGVAFRGDDLYIAQGEGSGVLGSALLRLDPAQPRPQKVADLAFFEQVRNPDDGERESNPFGLVYDARDDAFYLTDAAANSLLRISPSGTIDVVAVWRGGEVPTSVTRGGDGALYVSLFGRFPHQPGQGRVDRVGSDGSISVASSGLTMPVALATAPEGGLLALEFAGRFETTPRLRFLPDSGRLLRIAGARQDSLVERLPFPTGLLVESDGSVLVALRGALSGPGNGSVARVVACASKAG